MIGIKWVGWDASEWDMRSGLVKLAKGVLGLGALSYADFTQTSALRDGQRHVGWRGEPRKVLLPVLIGQSANELEWLTTDRAWWKTMHPAKAGQLQVTAPDGSRRSLGLRFVDDGGMSFDHDPTRDRLSVAVLSMIADDPWWVGPAFTKSFSAGSNPQNFFGGGTNLATPFIIGEANTIGSASVTNPGDVDAWPDYIVDGPCTAWGVTVNGKSVSASVELAANQQLVVETSPARQVATLVTGGFFVDGRRIGGVSSNVTKLLQSIEFTPIPAGTSVPLDVSINGTGKITLSGVPRYFRAW